MTRPEAIICDICGNEITEKGFNRHRYYKHVEFREENGIYCLPVFCQKIKADICDKCWKDMKDYIQVNRAKEQE